MFLNFIIIFRKLNKVRAFINFIPLNQYMIQAQGPPQLNRKKAKLEVGFPIPEVRKSEGGRWDTDDKPRFKSVQI